MWNVIQEGMRDAWRDWCYLVTTPKIIIPILIFSCITSGVAMYYGR